MSVQIKIIEVVDAYERELLESRQNRADTPTVYKNMKDQTVWVQEKALHQWRRERSGV